jgi:hypothetical protein
LSSCWSARWPPSRRGLAGDATEARRWIAGLDASYPERRQYERFVARFPEETFFREAPFFIDEMERLHRVTFSPESFRWHRETFLAGVRPAERYLRVRLRFAHPAISRQGEVYKLGYVGLYNDEDRALFLDRLGLFPIADIAEPRDLGHSMLAIRPRGGSMIFEFSPRALHAAVEDGEDPADLLADVFWSWAELLEGVEAILDGA